MFILDKERAKRILTDELGYNPVSADLFLRDYPPIHDELAAAVQAWLKDRTILDVSVLGLSISDIMRVRHSHFLMAVQDLNRLLDPDLSEEDRQRMVRILSKPYIRW